MQQSCAEDSDAPRSSSRPGDGHLLTFDSESQQRTDAVERDDPPRSDPVFDLKKSTQAISRSPDDGYRVGRDMDAAEEDYRRRGSNPHTLASTRF